MWFSCSMAAMVTFSVVMLLMSACNLIGMAIGATPPPMKPWFIGWFGLAFCAAAIATLVAWRLS